jgi:hypothetical protein
MVNTVFSYNTHTLIWGLTLCRKYKYLSWLCIYSCDVLPFEMLPCSDVPSGDESTKSCRRKKQPRWRKKFLAAGLFSDYYKEDEYV